MTIPAHPSAAGGRINLPLQESFSVSSSTIVQALIGNPAQSDANLWKNVDTETTSDYDYTANTTGARGGGFRLEQFGATRPDHVRGKRILKIDVRHRVQGGTYDTLIQLFHSGDEENDPLYYTYDMTHAVVATWYTTTFLITQSRVLTLDLWDQDQYWEFWKPTTGANRIARIGWLKIYEEWA
jgi:hypothetical protein